MEARKLKACGYCRVSTSKKSTHSTPDRIVFEQSLSAQEQAIRERAAASGWDLVAVYSDRDSGAKKNRTGLDALLDAARRRKFQVLVVPRLDRLARSLRQLVLLLDELRGLKISFVSLKERIDLGSPVGQAILGAVSIFAEIDRELSCERIVDGMNHAREAGTKSGLPVGRPTCIFDRQRVIDLRGSGEGWDKIAAKLGVSVSTLWRHVKRGKLGKIVPASGGSANQ